MAQEREWAEAQKITVSLDLVEAAKNQLKFLAAIDRNRFLHDDHVLERAIYRYNAFWLPLLAKHLENPVSEEPLVVPLDCELIWHCHRLNPVRYKFDCRKLFGRILGYHNVVSSVHETPKNTTEEIWNKIYPEEPYELDLQKPFSSDVLQKNAQDGKFTNYDLISAVKRQIPFTFQVSRSHMSDDLFLQEAVARYKGFLHLIRTNVKTQQQHLCVPTYDVDLIWHTHQLHPDLYCKDMIELVGYVVQHDDSKDESKKKERDNGHMDTTTQWEDIFGFSYWKAGGMSRGSIPTPVTETPFESKIESNDLKAFENCGLEIQFPTAKAVQVLLEFIDIKNLPENCKDNVFVAFSKKHHDKFFNAKRSLTISSHSKEKLYAMFQCEPTGEFLFELMSYDSPTSGALQPKNTMNLLGSCSLSFEDLLSSSQLWTDKWVSVDLVSDLKNSEPLLLHVSISFTPPTLAPQVFQMTRFEPLQHDQVQTCVVDEDGKVLFSLQKRNVVKDVIKCTSDLLAEVDCITHSGDKHSIIEFDGNNFLVKGTHGSFKFQNNSGKDDSLFELVGYKMVKFFRGRRLDFEPQHTKIEKPEQDFVTAIEFSKDYPYGKAIALINLRSKAIKAVDEWIVLPSIALTFILSDFTIESCNKENIITKRVDIHEGFSTNLPCHVAESGLPCHVAAKGAGSGLPCHVAAKGAASDLPCHVAAKGARSALPCHVAAKGIGSDLPCHVAAKGAGSDLPCHVAAKNAGSDLPCHIAAKGVGSGVPYHITAKGAGSDLPCKYVASSDLPCHVAAKGAGSDLPCHVAAKGAGSDLPCHVAVKGAGSDLPCHVAAKGAGSDLPYHVTAKGAGSNLPCHVAAKGADSGLPCHVAAKGGVIDLPCHVASFGLPCHVAGKGVTGFNNLAQCSANCANCKANCVSCKEGKLETANFEVIKSADCACGPCNSAIDEESGTSMDMPIMIEPIAV